MAPGLYYSHPHFRGHDLVQAGRPEILRGAQLALFPVDVIAHEKKITAQRAAYQALQFFSNSEAQFGHQVLAPGIFSPCPCEYSRARAGNTSISTRAKRFFPGTGRELAEDGKPTDSQGTLVETYRSLTGLQPRALCADDGQGPASADETAISIRRALILGNVICPPFGSQRLDGRFSTVNCS